ncbi:MAG: DUF6259 domain-containing protein [Eubacteriales bacterium]
MYELSNASVKIGFDETTGAIVELTNCRTGYALIRQPALALGLTMLVPVEEHRNNLALSENQRLSGIVKGAETVTLKYDRIFCNWSGEMDISAEIEVRLNGELILCSATVVNHSPYIVEEFRYPCFGGVAAPEGEDALLCQTMHFQGGIYQFYLGNNGIGNSDYWGTDHPTRRKYYPSPDVSAPFMLITGKKQGLYVGAHRYEPEFVEFLMEYKPGYLDNMHHRVVRDGDIPGVPAGYSVSVSQLPFIQPGETLKLTPIALQFYEGDWHEGIQPYMNWRKTWFRSSKCPRWIDDADCWMTLHINSPEGCCRHRYTELPAIMREAKKSGVKVLQLIGWARGGQDGDEPYQDTDPRLGTRQELKDAIAEIEAMGIHVLLMCKFKWGDSSTPEYKEELLPLTMKDFFGNPVYFGGYSYQTTLQNVSGGSRRSGAGLCHLSEDYRKIALREFDKILDLKPSGILYDELANPMMLCFDKNHGHRPGYCIHVGSVKLAEEFRREATAKCGEEFFMTGEGPLDVLNQYYPGNYIRSDNWGHAPIWKFMNPDLYIATCLVGFDDREMVNQCITYGYAMNYEPYNFKGTPDDVPLTKKAVLEAQAVRMKLKDYIWNGVFRHTVGVHAEVAGENCEFIYSMFVNKENGKRAVVAANQDSSKTLDVIFTLDGGSKAFTVYRPGTDETETSDGRVTVAPRTFCVLVED